MILKSNWVLVECHELAEEVVGRVQKRYPIPDGQAVWWACPACQGWHVVITNEENPPSLPDTTPSQFGANQNN